MNEFNAEQWASSHEQLCGTRFQSIEDKMRNVFAILAFIGVTFVGVSGWSLTNQYNTMQTQLQEAQASKARFEAMWNMQKKVADKVVSSGDQ